MSTSDAAELRRSLEAATLGLASMAVLMTRLGDLLVEWDKRALTPDTWASETWSAAASEVREIVAASGTGTRTAASMIRERGESPLTMADLRRRYDG